MEVFLRFTSFEMLVLVLEAVEARSGVDEDATLAVMSVCLCHGETLGSSSREPANVRLSKSIAR